MGGPFTGGALSESSTSKTYRKLEKELKLLAQAQAKQIHSFQLQKKKQQEWLKERQEQLRQQENENQDDQPQPEQDRRITAAAMARSNDDDNHDYDAPWTIHQNQSIRVRTFFQSIVKLIAKTLPMQADLLSQVWNIADGSVNIVGEWAAASRDTVVLEQEKRRHMVEEHTRVMSMARTGGIQREQRCYQHIKRLEQHLKAQEQVIANLREREQRLVAKTSGIIGAGGSGGGGTSGSGDETETTEPIQKEAWELEEELDVLQDKVDSKDRKLENMQLENTALRKERDKACTLLQRLMGSDVDGLAAAARAVKNFTAGDDMSDASIRNTFEIAKARQERTTRRITMLMDLQGLRHATLQLLTERKDIQGYPSGGIGRMGNTERADDEEEEPTTLDMLEASEYIVHQQLQCQLKRTLFPKTCVSQGDKDDREGGDTRNPNSSAFRSFPLVAAAHKLGGYSCRQYTGVVHELAWLLRMIRRVYTRRKDTLCATTSVCPSEMRIETDVSNIVLDTILQHNQCDEARSSKIAVDVSVTLEFAHHYNKKVGLKVNQEGTAQGNAQPDQDPRLSYREMSPDDQAWVLLFRNILVQEYSSTTLDFVVVFLAAAQECSRCPGGTIYPIHADLGCPCWISTQAAHLVTAKLFEGLPGLRIASQKDLKKIQDDIDDMSEVDSDEPPIPEVGIAAISVAISKEKRPPVVASSTTIVPSAPMYSLRIPLIKMVRFCVQIFHRNESNTIKQIYKYFEKTDAQSNGKINGHQLTAMFQNMGEADVDAKRLLTHVHLYNHIREETNTLDALEQLVMPIVSQLDDRDEGPDPTSSASLDRMLDFNSVVNIMAKCGYFIYSLGYVVRGAAPSVTSTAQSCAAIQQATHELLPTLEQHVEEFQEQLHSLRMLKENNDIEHAMNCFRSNVVHGNMPSRSIVHSLSVLRKVIESCRGRCVHVGEEGNNAVGHERDRLWSVLLSTKNQEQQKDGGGGARAAETTGVRG